jgi:hypothetical protein
VSVLQTKQPQTITVDLRKKTVYQMPRFIQHDTNILEIIIKDNGVDADLNNIGKIVVNYERPDKKIISRFLIKNESNKIEYKLGLEENEFAGLAEIQIQFFSIDNQERISTTRFDVLLSASIGTDKIYENNGELSLLQELFVEVESIKQSAENEDARIENESQRQDAEAERNTKEIERQLAETSRIEAESTRLTSEQTRETNEAIRQQQEAARQNNTAQIISEAQQAILNTEIVTQYATESGEYAVGKGNEAQALGLYAKQQGDRAQQIVDENKTIWLKPVTTFAAIATTYPNPVFGSKVITMDDQKEYRFTTFWEWTGIYSSNGVTALQAQLADANRQTQNLQHGTSILASALNSPVEFEVQGRTLISLSNSNLEGNKMYVLADKRTKIRVEGREGTLLNGVAKFTKSASLITKADFVGKTSGDLVTNPHIAKRTTASPVIGLQIPSAFTYEDYVNLPTLNGQTMNSYNINNGSQSQQLFSFNIIEQIERKLGRIPSDTVSGKVAWIKENGHRLQINYHGWGSSVGGNKVSLGIWDINGGWTQPIATSVLGTVSKVSYAVSNFNVRVDTNGFVHYLAFAEASDGTTPSQLNTDFIELEIELKATAVLDTRPIITRVATFEGKVSGDLVSNPHVYKNGASNTQIVPSGGFTETAQNRYDSIRTLDNGYVTNTNNINGFMIQQLFSFNLIEEIERNIGRIPKATVAEKVQWIKDWVQTLQFDHYGFGSSVGGNKMTLSRWNAVDSVWVSAGSHSSAVPVKYSSIPNVANSIDANGMFHALAYAEPSDGTTASTINTDFVSLDITLKQGATLHDPMLPLYEVDATDYANILVSWDENTVMSRFPKVQGVQHLQNLAVIADGENLLPPFHEWTLHANAKVVSPYELELNATSSYNETWYSLKVVTGQTYTLRDNGGRVIIYKGIGTTGAAAASRNSGNSDIKVTVDSSFNGYMTVKFDNNQTIGKFTYSNPMLTIGDTPKPFVPRNPSYLFAQTKLGQVGTVKDSLFKQGENWTMVERVKKDVVLDGTLVWNDSANYTGFKRASVLGVAPNSSNGHSSNMLATKYDGTKTEVGATWGDRDLIRIEIGNVYVVVKNIDSGFGETYRPLSDEWKAYFNGWQAKTTDGNGKPTTWRSLGDGTDAPTQTLAYVSANKAPNFTPYKLSYVLASPQTQIVNHLVEGDIVVSGNTQVEVTSGVVVRERVTPYSISGNYFINREAAGDTSKLKNKTKKIYGVYKNGSKDSLWTIEFASAFVYGSERAFIKQEMFDTTATYEVTYLVLDRHLHTVNALDVKASYAGNFKEVQDMQVEKVSDLATQQSVLANQMYRVLVAAKGAGWNV